MFDRKRLRIQPLSARTSKTSYYPVTSFALTLSDQEVEFIDEIVVDIKEKKKVISDMGKELRERTEKRLDSLTPKTFSMMRKLLKKGNKDKLNTAIGSLVDSKIVKEGSTVSDILELDNAVEIIQQLNFLVDNHASIFLDFNQMR